MPCSKRNPRRDESRDGNAWIRMEKKNKTNQQSERIHSIPSHSIQAGLGYSPAREEEEATLCSCWISTRPQLGGLGRRRWAGGGSGQTVRQGQGIRQRVGVRAPRRSGQGGRRRRGLGGSWLGLVDWRETRRGARVGGGGGERSRSPATRFHRCCVLPVCSAPVPCGGTHVPRCLPAGAPVRNAHGTPSL